MSDKLATFRVDEETWQSFKALCKEESSNASADLLAYIQWRLNGGKISEPSHPLPQANRQTDLDAVVEQDIDSKIEAKLTPLLDRIDKLEIELGKFAA